MLLSAARPATGPSAAQRDGRVHGQIQASTPIEGLIDSLGHDVHLGLCREISAETVAYLAGAPALLQMFAHELPQLRVFGDLPDPLAAPPALGIALSRPWTVVTGGFVDVPADLSAHSRRTTPELPGNGADAAPRLQEVRDRDPFRFGEKPGGDHDRPLMRDGSVLLDVSGLQNNRVSVPPAST
ncbi:hypothetical protein D9M72_403210 [compost metagenome]